MAEKCTWFFARVLFDTVFMLLVIFVASFSMFFFHYALEKILASQVLYSFALRKKVALYTHTQHSCEIKRTILFPGNSTETHAESAPNKLLEYNAYLENVAISHNNFSDKMCIVPSDNYW